MGKKGSTTVQSYTPTAEEKQLMQQAVNYADAVSPNALALNNLASTLLSGSYGAVQADYGQMNTTAQNQIAAAQAGLSSLAQGQLPTAYTDNLQSALNRSLSSSIGSTLQDLGARGVLNSSVTNTALAGLSDSAANAITSSYQNGINQLANLYTNQIANATAPITASSAAQEAAQKPALDLWSASLGLNGSTTSALGALSRGNTTTTTTEGSGGLIGGVLTGAASGLFCFTADTLIATPDGDVPIKRLRAGDDILTVNHDGTLTPGTVLATMTPHTADVYTVICEKGAVHTTASQPLRTADGTDRTVDALTIGTDLARQGTVRSIIHSGKRTVYDLKTDGSNYYLANNFIAKGGTREWDS